MSTLTDRYVFATTRAVPEAQRDELTRELRGEIAEMIDARVADAAESPAAAEKAALLELGDPERLAASYADRPLQLIGPTYFLIWKRLLTVLLAWVPGILAVLVAGGQLLDGADVGEAIGDGVATAIELAVQIAFWTTLTFALLDRYGKPSDAPDWSPSELPELPAQSHVGLAETAGSLATSVVTIALLAWQELRGVIETQSGERVPLIDSALWSSWLPVLVAALVAEMLLAVFAYRRGRWTWPLVAAFAAASLAFAVPAIALLLGDAFFDPRFVAEVDWLGEGDHLHQVGIGLAVSIGLITAADLFTRMRAALSKS